MQLDFENPTTVDSVAQWVVLLWVIGLEGLWRLGLELLQRRHGGAWAPGWWGRIARPALWLVLWFGASEVWFWVGGLMLLGLEWFGTSPIREPSPPAHWWVVRAHEQGHLRHRHVTQRGVWFALGVGVWCVFWQVSLSGAVLLWATYAWHFWTRCPTHALRWRQEYQADQESLLGAGSAEVLAVLRLIQAHSLSWHPWFALQYSSHPPIPLRVAALD